MNTRSNIIAIYRNLTLLNLFLINILYCFKVAINFFFIFDIKNIIIKRTF